MELITTLNTEERSAVIAILTTATGFCLYWFTATNGGIKSRYFAGDGGADRHWVRYVVFQRLSGVVFLGVIPAVVAFTLTTPGAHLFGLGFGHFGASLAYTGVIGFLIVALTYVASNQPHRLQRYPEMRVALWTARVATVNALAWAAYLVAYEFLFRGLLLFLCYEAFGFWPAAAVNVALYATTHIPKGPEETAGSIPYGLLLCYVTLSTGSLFAAIATHLIMALSNDGFSIYHSKKMRSVK
jgi:membrane protease YdiL (CAAX protease family)